MEVETEIEFGGEWGMGTRLMGSGSFSLQAASQRTGEPSKLGDPAGRVTLMWIEQGTPRSRVCVMCRIRRRREVVEYRTPGPLKLIKRKDSGEGAKNKRKASGIITVSQSVSQ